MASNLGQPCMVSFFVPRLVRYLITTQKWQMNTPIYDSALRNTTVDHAHGCVAKDLYPTLPRFKSKMALVWDRSIGDVVALLLEERARDHQPVPPQHLH